MAADEKPKEKPKIPEPYDSIVRLAYTAPPEFAADALLRVVESGKVPDKPALVDLVEHAYSLGGSAQLRAPVKALKRVPDTPGAMLAAASQLHLDALSLQSRAVRDMASLDRKKAWELFLTIPAPAVEQPKCEDMVITDVSPLRDLAATFGEDGINAKSLPPDPTMPDCSSPEVASTFWKSEKGQRIFKEAYDLRFGSQSLPRAEWLDHLTDFLKDLGDWNASDEKSEADFYHQRSTIYEMLVEITPPGPERNRVLLAYVSFIAGSNLQRERPAEWFYYASSLLSRSRSTSSAEVEKVLDAFGNSGNAALMLCAQLARI